MDDTAYERAFLETRQIAELEAADKAVDPAIKQLHRDFAKLYGNAIDKLLPITLSPK
jgi:hypothetical protein